MVSGELRHKCIVRIIFHPWPAKLAVVSSVLCPQHHKLIDTNTIQYQITWSTNVFVTASLLLDKWQKTSLRWCDMICLIKEASLWSFITCHTLQRCCWLSHISRAVSWIIFVASVSVGRQPVLPSTLQQCLVMSSVISVVSWVSWRQSPPVFRSCSCVAAGQEMLEGWVSVWTRVLISTAVKAGLSDDQSDTTRLQCGSSSCPVAMLRLILSTSLECQLFTPPRGDSIFVILKIFKHWKYQIWCHRSSQRIALHVSDSSQHQDNLWSNSSHRGG